MADNIAENNGRASMAFRGKTPWHRLGASMNDKPNATDKEWLEESGTDFQVGLSPVICANSNYMMKDARILYRTDTGVAFEDCRLVRANYRPIQNAEVLDFARQLTKNDPQVKIETIGALGQGETVWFLLELGGFSVKGDEMQKYLLLNNAHNGLRAFRGLLTSTRVVCQNTLNIAMSSGAKDGFAIRHKGDLKGNLQAAQDLLGFSLTQYEEFEKTANLLANKSVKSADVDTVLNLLYPDPEKKTNEETPSNTNAVNQRNKVKELFEKGEGNDRAGIKGTIWALVNGVTDYVDHWQGKKSEVKKGKETERLEKNFQFALMGGGADLKQQAWNLGLELLKNGKIEVSAKPTVKQGRKSKSGGTLVN